MVLSTGPDGLEIAEAEQRNAVHAIRTEIKGAAFPAFDVHNRVCPYQTALPATATLFRLSI